MKKFKSKKEILLKIEERKMVIKDCCKLEKELKMEIKRFKPYSKPWIKLTSKIKNNKHMKFGHWQYVNALKFVLGIQEQI